MKQARTKHLDFILGDILALELAHGIMVFVSNGRLNEELLKWYLQLGILLAVINLAVIAFTDSYRDVLRRGYLKEMIAVCKRMVVVFALEIVFLFAFQLSAIFSRWILFATLFLGIFLMYGERLLLKSYLKKRFRQVKYARTLMVIATADQARIMIQRLNSSALSIFKIEGLAVTDQDMKGLEIEGILVTANKGEIPEYVSSHIVDEILISVPDDPQYESKMAKLFLSIGLVVHIYMEQYFQDLPNREQQRISGMNVLTCFNREIPMGAALLKRLMDIAGGLVGTVLALIVGMVIGPIIYIKSPGPIIFSQIRVGRNGRKFRIYKFRSMYMDAEERKKELMDRNKIKGNMFKIDDDPRIIPGIGHFIRRTSLDEFPQFFNVLKGDMSLVGTRPPTVDEYEKYSFYQNKRLAVKPGITGVWQISGRSNITDFDEVVRLDSEYIDDWNIEKDIKILLKTILVIFTRKGSA